MIALNEHSGRIALHFTPIGPRHTSVNEHYCSDDQYNGDDSITHVNLREIVSFLA